MVKKKYSELPEENISNTSVIPFENGSGETKRSTALVTSALATGLSIKYLFTEADFPAPVGGFIRPESGIKYIATTSINITTPILLEAGLVTDFDTTFLRNNIFTFSGFAGTAIQTLNLDGLITAFADSTESGVKTTVTSTAHGLSENDKVNIFNVDTETQYNGTGLTVTNVTTNTFDIPVVFVATDTGEFDTGIVDFRIKIRLEDGTGTFPNGTLKAFDLTYTAVEPGPTFDLQAGVIGFADIGIIRKAGACAIANGLFIIPTAANSGLILDNVVNTRLIFTGFRSLNPTNDSTAITFQGSATQNLDMLTCPFSLLDVAAFPMKINNDISSTATMKITNCSATPPTQTFFDPTGIDQTDPRVTLVNSLPSPESQSMAEGRSSGTLVVDGSVGVGAETPIVDITPVNGDWIEDATTEEWTVDPTTGIATYNGLDPRSITARYELSATQSTGPNQTIIFDVHLNGIVEPKSSRTLVTAGTGNFTQVTYIGGSFNIVNGDTIQLFKTNDTNTNNTDVKDATLIIKKNG